MPPERRKTLFSKYKLAQVTAQSLYKMCRIAGQRRSAAMDCISLPAWATEAPGSPKSIFVESAPSEESACSLSGDASASEEESPPAAAATHVAVPKGSGASMTRSLTFRDRALESAYLASSSASLVGLDSAASGEGESLLRGWSCMASTSSPTQHFDCFHCSPHTPLLLPAAALAVVLWLSFYSKQHWELSLAEKGVFYASVALASLFFCAVPLAPRLRQRLVRWVGGSLRGGGQSPLAAAAVALLLLPARLLRLTSRCPCCPPCPACRHRTACVLALRLMGVGNMVVFGRHSVLPQTISSTTVFKVAVRAGEGSRREAAEANGGVL